MNYVLLIIPDGKLEVAGYDTLLFVVTGGIASKFKNLSGEIFQNSGQVY